LKDCKLWKINKLNQNSIEHRDINNLDGKERKQPGKPGSRSLPIFAGLLISALLVCACLGWFFYAAVSNAGDFTLKIDQGKSLSQLVNQLEEDNKVNSARRILLVARLTGLDKGIQLGEFELNGSMSPLEILRSLQNYAVPEISFRIPDGISAIQTAGLLARIFEIDSSLFRKLIFQPAIAHKQGLQVKNLEGLLYPDTYRVSQGESAEVILTKIVNRFKNELAIIFKGNIPDSLNLRRLITMASIVQGEFQVASEADTIAAVYLNRLQTGMKLQADPTVQFILGDKPRRLLLKDLQIDSPYNTYKYHGLPPGPINSPGGVALKAVVHPAVCDYLYFVAAGDGSHRFARTYEQHLKNRQPLDAIRRKLRKNP
jgi:UPF0755 protein